MKKKTQLCPECSEAEKISNLDIQCVLDKLESENRVSLTPQQKRYLCVSLWLCDTYQVAFQLKNNRRPSVEEINHQDVEIIRIAQRLNQQMSDNVHRYIKSMMGIQQQYQKRPDWSKVVCFFQEKGCDKHQLSNPIEMQRCMFVAKFKGNISKRQIQEKLSAIGIEIEIIERLSNDR